MKAKSDWLNVKTCVTLWYEMLPKVNKVVQLRWLDTAIQFFRVNTSQI